MKNSSCVLRLAFLSLLFQLNILTIDQNGVIYTVREGNKNYWFVLNFWMLSFGIEKKNEDNILGLILSIKLDRAVCHLWLESNTLEGVAATSANICAGPFQSDRIHLLDHRFCKRQRLGHFSRLNRSVDQHLRHPNTHTAELEHRMLMLASALLSPMSSIQMRTIHLWKKRTKNQLTCGNIWI